MKMPEEETLLVDAASYIDDALDIIKKNRADDEERFDALQSKIRTLTDRVEELEWELAEADKRMEPAP